MYGMNKFYYPVIFIDNMDKFFIAASNYVLTGIIFISLILFCVYFSVRIFLLSKKGLIKNKKIPFTKHFFYISSVWLGILCSTAFILFIAIPLLFYTEILLYTMYIKENADNTKEKFFTIGCIIFFSLISVILNVCPVIFWL